MAVGPVQVIFFGFDEIHQFRGEVLDELARLRGQGLIRLIDLYLAVKTQTGKIVTKQMNDLTEAESVEFGQVIGKLMGLSDQPKGEVSAAAMEQTLAASFQSIGFDYQAIQEAVHALPPGKAFGVLMLEHTWAVPLRDAIRRAGGVPLAQGFLTQEALMMVGEELQAVADAERTIEVAEIVQSAAILDTLATLKEAEANKTAVAADVVRTLAVAELIQEAAVPDAIETLEAANLLEARYVEEAAKLERQEAAQDKVIFAEMG
jgi:uncharacterized membrane protein